MTFSLFLLSGLANAGQIHEGTADMSHAPTGFQAWSMENVSMTVDGGSYDAATGAYTLGAEGTYKGAVDDGQGKVTAHVGGKTWPVGEPPGIKVVHGDLDVKEGRPVNCLMTTSYLEGGTLDLALPTPTICSSDFQTHKRFKVAMAPGSLEGKGVDLVFKVSPSEGSVDYQVFQKINNYTDSRLEGFEVQLGVGLGADFQRASVAGLSEALALSIPAEMYDPEDIATFSHGLFGPADKHFPEDGFFGAERAGFFTELAPFTGQTGIGDLLASTTTLGSNYAQVPPETGPAEQFGPWLPSTWIPLGYFFDDDGNPETDASLMAFWGESSAGSGEFTWMQGNAQGFAPVPEADLALWEADPAYSTDFIEDLLNLSLNYVLTVGTVDASWPTWQAESETATFTLRFVPIADSSTLGAPTYMGNIPGEPHDTGDTGDTGETGPVDSSTDDSQVDDTGTDPDPSSCGCSSQSQPVSGWAAMGLMLLGLATLRRRK